jgi:segregation and condensation protein B
MGPPRLSIVGSAENDDRADRDDKVATPANDASAPTDGTSPSPVHDLINTIETRTAGDGDATGQSEAEVAPSPERAEKLRILEAVIFASAEPLDEARLATYLKAGDDVPGLLSALVETYSGRGVNLVKVAGKWAFRTAEDLSWALERHAKQERRLSRAALETLAIVAYHQPVTRAEIEEVRGVTISKGTLDVLMEAGFVRPRGRRRAPGKPLTYGTTDLFLEHFGLAGVGDLPGIADLKAAGLLDSNLPPDFKMPSPNDTAALMPDELPLDAGEAEDAQAELELDEPLESDEDDADEDGDEDTLDEPKA